MAKTVAHICILVRDIDEAVEKYRNILSVVSPELLKGKVVKQKRFADSEEYVTAFFGSSGDGCDIQFLQPPDKNSPLYKRLEKYGEGIHHIAFSSSHLEDSYKKSKEKDIAVNDRLVAESPAEKDEVDMSHFWILPKSSNGVLIEVIDSYQVHDGFLTRK